jgi:hypothetical protein
MTLGRLETCCPPSQKWHAQHEKVAAHSLLPRVQVQIAGAAVHVQQPNHMSVVKLFEKGNLTQSNGRNAILSETESFDSAIPPAGDNQVGPIQTHRYRLYIRGAAVLAQICIDM